MTTSVHHSRYTGKYHVLDSRRRVLATYALEADAQARAKAEAQNTPISATRPKPTQLPVGPFRTR